MADILIPKPKTGPVNMVNCQRNNGPMVWHYAHLVWLTNAFNCEEGIVSDHWSQHCLMTSNVEVEQEIENITWK